MFWSILHPWSLDVKPTDMEDGHTTIHRKDRTSDIAKTQSLETYVK